MFYYLLVQLGATPLFSTVALLSLLIFIAQLSFFICLKYFTQLNQPPIKNITFAIITGAVLYGFSPYVIAMIIPGHIVTLYVYACFPLIIRYLDALLTDKRLDMTASIMLFLIFAFCAPGFANIGLIYVLLIACAIYVIALVLAKNLPIGQSAFRLSFFVTLLLISNAWWLTPHLYNIKHYVAMSTSSATNMAHIVAYASKDASIANILLGRPESLMYMFDIVGNSYYVNSVLCVIFLAISLLIIITTFGGQRQIRVFLFAVLSSILFVKGTHPPFSDIFIWAYDNVPGFQIFRRPVAKFNGFFIFYFLAGATLGFGVLLKKSANFKWKRRTLFGGALFAAAYLVFIFTQTSSLAPFNIPKMYYKAANHLLEDHVERVLILPGTNGLNPVYRADMDFYTGQDFINEVFRFPKIIPDSTSNSLNEPYKVPTNKLMRDIRENRSICADARTLGISHIIVRDDLISSQVEDLPRLIIATLDKHRDVIKKSLFTDDNNTRLVVYKVKMECTAKLLQLNGNYSAFRYDYINPGKIVLNIEGLRGPATLTFLSNFNTNWEVFAEQADRLLDKNHDRSSVSLIYSDSGFLKLNFDELQYLFRPAPLESTHSLSSQYANSWILNSSLLKRALESTESHLNVNEPINIRLVLFYRPQSFFYLGVVISLFCLVALLLYWIKMTPRKIFTSIFRRRSND